MANKSLLNEAIAEAAEIREAALANAKAALEESFTPKLKELFSQKVQEMEKDEDDKIKKEAKKSDDKEELEEMDAPSFDRKSGPSITPAPEKVGKSTIQEEEEDLDEVLSKLDEEMDEVEEGYGKKHDKKMDEAEDDKDDMHEEEAEEDDEESEDMEDDDDIDLDELSADEFREHVKDVIVKMIDDGEIEAGPEFEGDGEDMEMDDMDGEIEIDDSEEMAIAAEGEDKEDLDEVGSWNKETFKRKTKSMEESEDLDEAKHEDDDKAMEEALAEINKLKADLQEVNLLNAKLLYSNKIFRSKNLSESKKVKVLESFDKAATVKEAKLIFETLNEGISSTVTRQTNRPSVKRMASKPMNVIKENKQPIVESNDMVARFQKLAGIK